jgi:glycerol-3-phosphate acyltransferase PlsY
MVIWGIVAAVAVGYLLGNLNGAIIISKWLMKEDVRSKGSGNAGLTNYFRSYGGVQSLLVILIDMGKTVLACYFGGFVLKWLGHEELWVVGKMIGGFASAIGHIFPVFFRFHGGKGILCGGAMALVMEPRILLLLLVIFVLLFAATHYVSLGSVTAAICYPALYWIFFRDNVYVMVLALALGLLAVIQHRQNIVRLIHGTETKVYLKKK